MLDLPGQPVLDKHSLVGACVRLPLRVDAERLLAEVALLPGSVWGSRGGRVGVHSAAEALFLRGYAPAEGPKPIENRPPLELLPYAREIIEEIIPAPPLRCLLARLPAETTIAPHIDRAPYFSKSLRVHVAVETHEHAWMLCAGQAYIMRPGEVWVLNNSAEHAVWNAHATLSRTHMICDFLASPALVALLANGERALGRTMPDVERQVRSGGHTMVSG
ncbi:MAG: aspartyl/asparaginyl beta-hydroxylase domain-containing protein [Gammaproteobacteria bacterium]